MTHGGTWPGNSCIINIRQLFWDTLYLRQGAEHGQDVQEEDDDDGLAEWLGTVSVRTNHGHIPVNISVQFLSRLHYDLLNNKNEHFQDSEAELRQTLLFEKGSFK